MSELLRFCFINDLVYLKRLNKLQTRLIVIAQTIFNCQVLLFHSLLFVTDFCMFLYPVSQSCRKIFSLTNIFYKILAHNDRDATRFILKNTKVEPII